MKQTQEEVDLDTRFDETQKECLENLEENLQDMEDRFHKLKGLDKGKVMVRYYIFATIFSKHVSFSISLAKHFHFACFILQNKLR